MSTKTFLRFILILIACVISASGCSSSVVVGRTAPPDSRGRPEAPAKTEKQSVPKDEPEQAPPARAEAEATGAAGSPAVPPAARSEPVVVPSTDSDTGGTEKVRPPTVVPRSSSAQAPEDEIESPYELELSIGGYGMSEGYFDTPVAVAADEQEETIYVLDQENHRIQCFDSYGEYQFEWGRQGSGAGEYYVSQVDGVDTLRMTGDFEFNYPLDMIIGRDERWDLVSVTVADTLNNRIQRFLVVPDVFDTLPGEVFAMLPKGGTLTYPDESLMARYESEETKVILDPLYLSEQKADNALLTPFLWGGLGYSEGMLNKPSSLALGEDILYVADTNNKRVQLFFNSPLNENSYMRYYSQIGSDINMPFGEGRLYEPVAVVYDNSDYGGVLVLDRDRDDSYSIQRFGRDGEYQGEFKISGGLSAGLRYPVDMAINPFDNTLFITDKGHRAVMVYNNRGEFMFSIGGGELKDPRGICVLRNGYVYVTDAATNMVHMYVPR